jgi:hypothetical protein
MFRVTVICDGLPGSAGEKAASDIAKEFADHRQWHSRVTCEWDGSRLVLRSENDFDDNGRATLDEFGDCLSAYVPDPGQQRLTVASVSKFDPPPA